MRTVFLCWDLKMVALLRIKGGNRTVLKIGQVRIKITHLRTSETSSIDQNFNLCQFPHLLSVLNGVPDIGSIYCEISIPGNCFAISDDLAVREEIHQSLQKLAGVVISEYDKTPKGRKKNKS